MWRVALGVWLSCTLSACSLLSPNHTTTNSCQFDHTQSKSPAPPPADNPQPPPGHVEESEPVPDRSPYHAIQPPPPLQRIAEPPRNSPPAPPIASGPPHPVAPPPVVPTPVAHQEVVPAVQPGAVAALHHLIKNDRQDEMLLALKGYSPLTQEYLMRLLPAVAYLDKKGGKALTPDEMTELQEQLGNLVQELRKRAPLIIDNMHCCEQIHGYGSYKQLPEDHEFQPTQGRRPGEKVQVYLELRNFASEKRDGYFVTCLDSTVALQKATGDGRDIEVWKKSFQDGNTPLRSLTPRNDCFNMYTFCVPNIPPGRYRLTIQIADKTRQPVRESSKTIDFVVGAGPLAQAP
jgi:hypothetical protein